MQRIEEEGVGSVWSVFLEGSFGKRLVFASLALALILLKEVEGHSVEELSQMTGMNENTIKVKLFRARQKLVKAAQRLGRLPGAPKTA